MRNKDRSIRSTAAVLISGLIAASASAAVPPVPPGPPALGVTSPAPALAVTHWYKGAPINAFAPGKVYVVEFWATWCAPCKKSIPHLTGLQKKFGDKATFIGVDVWEHPDDETDAAIAELARPFVERMGDTMAYTVAGDGAAGAMSKTWLAPAKQLGIPTAFVVDGGGNIAWIGHPDRLEPVLDQMVAGTWDAVAEKKRADDARVADENSPENKEIAKLTAARTAGETAAVLAAFEEIDAGFPKLATRQDVIAFHLQTLLRTNAAATVTYVQKLTAVGAPIAQSPTLTWPVLRVAAGEKESLLTTAQWKAITTVLDPINAPGNGKFAPAYAAYAELARRAGEHDLAVFYQRHAVNLVIAKMDDDKATVGKAAKVDTDYLKTEQAKLDALTATAAPAAGAS